MKMFSATLTKGKEAQMERKFVESKICWVPFSIKLRLFLPVGPIQQQSSQAMGTKGNVTELQEDALILHIPRQPLLAGSAGATATD